MTARGVDAVGIAAVNGVFDFDAADENVVAIDGPQGPAGRILDAHVFDAEVFAIVKLEHRRRARQGFPAMRNVVLPGIFRRRLDAAIGHPEICTLAIDAAGAGKADIFRAASENQMLLVGVAFGGRAGLGGIVVEVLAAEQRGAGFEVKRDVALQNDCARKIGARREIGHPTAAGVAGLNGAIYRGGVQSFAVAGGAEFGHVKEAQTGFGIARERSRCGGQWSADGQQAHGGEEFAAGHGVKNSEFIVAKRLKVHGLKSKGQSRIRRVEGRGSRGMKRRTDLDREHRINRDSHAMRRAGLSLLTSSTNLGGNPWQQVLLL